MRLDCVYRQFLFSSSAFGFLRCLVVTFQDDGYNSETVCEPSAVPEPAGSLPLLLVADLELEKA
jgi:hypothetical protein